MEHMLWISLYTFPCNIMPYLLLLLSEKIVANLCFQIFGLHGSSISDILHCFRVLQMKQKKKGRKGQDPKKRCFLSLVQVRPAQNLVLEVYPMLYSLPY
ncbi:hypothetical protein RchiOBHm_Chr7g0199511 [Rosa chinensis]|uniref:Uncharacterized protein n=1 Tax=Rosa chinensis TaxID=74649 RepID=A0A2P6P7E0_ROSCH|nr:hypothetical protein RchiOBHm_Chr7g0199511 [Rosa chinensis]